MKMRRIVDTNLLIENVFTHLDTIFRVKPSVKIAFSKKNHLSHILQAMDYTRWTTSIPDTKDP
jgi:hypothetical protein